MSVKPSLDPMTVLREFHDKKDQFRCSTGKDPTRVIMNWRVWDELTEPYRQFTVKCATPEDGKTRFEGLEVIRTNDSPGLLEFLL